MAVANFLLGPPKLKPDYARGKYGEGMKIATLAFIRKGYPVKMETGNEEMWIIFLEQEADVKVPTLSALWRPVGLPRTELDFTSWAIPEMPLPTVLRSISPGSRSADGPSQITQPVRRFNQLIQTEGEIADFCPGYLSAGNRKSLFL